MRGMKFRVRNLWGKTSAKEGSKVRSWAACSATSPGDAERGLGTIKQRPGVLRLLILALKLTKPVRSARPQAKQNAAPRGSPKELAAPTAKNILRVDHSCERHVFCTRQHPPQEEKNGGSGSGRSCHAMRALQTQGSATLRNEASP